MAFGTQTYGNTTGERGVMREDLMDVITDLSPDMTPLVTMLGTSTAKNTTHEWPEDYQSRATSVSSAAEAANPTFADDTAVARRLNYTQIITQPVQVSGTARDVDFAGMGDPMTYYKQRGLTTLKLNMEYAVLRGAIASGASGTARQMKGITQAVTTLVTARNSGTSLSEDMFNEAAQVSWTEVGDKVFDLVLVPGGLKRKISSFTAGNTRNMVAEDKRLVRPVAVYEHDFGVARIMAHQDVDNTAGSVHMIGIREDTFKIAYLRNPHWKALGATGDADKGMYITELTLEFLAERASIKQTGFTQNG